MTEKLDGSCCAVAKIGGIVLPLVRAGYRVESSRYKQHHLFAHWVYANYVRFGALLAEGERLVGEWLAQAHGTRYDLRHEPFVAFDLMRGHERAPFDEFSERVQGNFVVPHLLHDGGHCSIEWVQELLSGGGGHGALDGPEGAVWRVERLGKVDFSAKWVRPDKLDGMYMPEVSGQREVWNWRAESRIQYSPEEGAANV